MRCRRRARPRRTRGAGCGDSSSSRGSGLCTACTTPRRPGGLRSAMTNPLVSAVVYDLDGTLIDSRDDLADSVNAMLARLRLPQRAPEVIYGFIGEGAERLIRRSLGIAHEERYPEAAPIWREEYGRRLLAKTRLYDGVAALLGAKPDRRGVLTNKPGSFAREILRGLGVLGAFRAVVGGDEAPRKPSPDGLLRLCS